MGIQLDLSIEKQSYNRKLCLKGSVVYPPGDALLPENWTTRYVRIP
jgi:hypothetical protein